VAFFGRESLVQNPLKHNANPLYVGLLELSTVEITEIRAQRFQKIHRANPLLEEINANFWMAKLISEEMNAEG
jgi:hypothetical protein